MTDREDPEAAATQAIQSIISRAVSEAHTVIKAVTAAAATTTIEVKQSNEGPPPYDEREPYRKAADIDNGADLAPINTCSTECIPSRKRFPECEFSIACISQSGQTHVHQYWNVYGDSSLKKQTAPMSHLFVGGNVYKPASWRAKLTREYQEIMWAVAQKMDASFLRPIFDKYNPRATQTADLARRARELAAREVAHEAARVAHEAARVAHKAHTEHERAELAAQSQAATLRLQSAISKEADRAITADMLSRAVELRTTHDALRTMVRGIAHEICADVRAPVEYGSRLLAALGESDD